MKRDQQRDDGAVAVAEQMCGPGRRVRRPLRGFSIDVLAAYRPTGKGRVERQVLIVREHVLAGRTFASLAELDEAFTRWVPIRRGRSTCAGRAAIR